MSEDQTYGRVVQNWFKPTRRSAWTSEMVRTTQIMQNANANTLVRAAEETRSGGPEPQLLDSNTVKSARVRKGITSCGNIWAVSLRRILRDWFISQLRTRHGRGCRDWCAR